MKRITCRARSCFAALLATALLPGQSAPVPAPATPPRPVAVAPAPAAPAPSADGSLQFGFQCDGEQVLVEVDGENWQAMVGGRKLPEQRARRTGSRIQVFDRDGLVAAQVTLFGSGGTLQRFADRQRVAVGMRLGVVEPDSARLVGFEPAQIRRVLSVTPGQPAAKAGLQPGDLLVEVEGKRPVNESRLRSVLQKKRPGELLPLSVNRGGKTLQLAVRLEPAATFLATPRSDGTGTLEGAANGARTVPPRTPADKYLRGLRALGGDGAASEIANLGTGLQPAPSVEAPLVHLDGNKMLVMEEPDAPPVARRPGAASPAGADPIAELRRIQERLEAMERLLQRVLEMREKTERERTDAGKSGAARRDGK